jgi:hypothetical protein
MNTHFVDLLTENILWQAEYYLNDCDEFYPFGCGINVNSELKPFSVYWGNDHPKSANVIDELENAIKSQINLKIYEAAAIGVDVYLNLPNSMDKGTAIQIRYFPSGISEEKLFRYSKIDGKYHFETVS